MIARSPYASIGDAALESAAAALVCPAGTFKSCIVSAPGTPPSSCSCFKTPSLPTLTQQAGAGFSAHWGLIAAVGLGAFLVYKIALR